MNNSPKTGFVAVLSPLFLMAGLWACPADDGPPKRHPSPKAVFDAYRETRARRDVRAYSPFLTRKEQDRTVFEYYLGCCMFDSDKTRAVLKRYGVDEATLTSDLRREHKAKHGVEPADDNVLWRALEKDYEAKHVAPPHSSYPVLSDILGPRIKDKAGFCEAADRVVHAGPPTLLGDLERVVVQGDTATWHVAIPSPVAEGQAPGSKGTYDKTFDFRKVDGGWLLDSL